MYPRIEKVVFDGNDGKTIFCILFLFSYLFFWKDNVCAKNPLYFPLFLKLFESFSLFTSKHRKIRQKKPSFFVFVQSLFWLIFSFNIFPFSSRSSLLSLFTFSVHLFCSSLFAFLSFFFSLFSPFFFFSFSVFLFLFFCISCFLICFFSPLPFLRFLFLVLTHLSSLFCSWSHSSFP